MFKKKWLLIVVIIATALCIIGSVIVFQVIEYKKNSRELVHYAISDNEISSAMTEKRKHLLTIKNSDIVIGEKDAPVVIISYDSLSCYHCADFYINIFPVLKKKFINNKKLVFVHRDFPIDKPALSATILLHCNKGKLTSEKILNIITSLYIMQQEWVSSKNFQEKLIDIFRMSGMSESEATNCLKNQKLEDSIIQSRIDASNILNINATPTLFLNGIRYSSKLDMENIVRTIEGNLKQ